jgi:hypothetical protein
VQSCKIDTKCLRLRSSIAVGHSQLLASVPVNRQLMEQRTLHRHIFVLRRNTCLYSSVVERQSCKLKVLGSIPSGGLWQNAIAMYAHSIYRVIYDLPRWKSWLSLIFATLLHNSALKTGSWIRHAPANWPCGLMDKALVFGTKDCRFESCQGHYYFAWELSFQCNIQNLSVHFEIDAHTTSIAQ